MNKLIFGHQTVLKPLLISLRSVNSDDGRMNLCELDKNIDENAQQRNVLIGLMTKGYLEPAVYNKGNNELIQEGKRIQCQKESLLQFLRSDSKNLNEVSTILQYVSKAKMLTGFDGDVFTRFVAQIIVYSRTEIGFKLKCGITLKERLVK